MKYKSFYIFPIAILLFFLFSLVGCTKEIKSETKVPSSDDSVSNIQTEPVPLVPYTGVVEHIFFHPVIAYPELAFDGDAQTNGFDDWMVTVEEYNHILKELYQNNYILVDIHTVWSETENAAGKCCMTPNTLMLPEGKKPLIISYDDVNYYQYMLENGITYKLILGEDGELWSWGLDPNGNEIVSQDLDAITLLEKFVQEHPDFSLNGAKGCIGLTGYEGILGYRTQTDRDNCSQKFEENRQKEIKAVKPVIAKLKNNGWTFASHTWGHIRMESHNLSSVQDDTQRWLNEVGSLIGKTQVLLYPYGSRPDGNDVTQTGECFRYLQSKGFRIFASVGSSSYTKIKSDISAVICDRLHPDGKTLRWNRDRYLHLFDAWNIIDLEKRPHRQYDRSEV